MLRCLCQAKAQRELLRHGRNHRHNNATTTAPAARPAVEALATSVDANGNDANSSSNVHHRYLLGKRTKKTRNNVQGSKNGAGSRSKSSSSSSSRTNTERAHGTETASIAKFKEKTMEGMDVRSSSTGNSQRDAENEGEGTDNLKPGEKKKRAHGKKNLDDKAALFSGNVGSDAEMVSASTNTHSSYNASMRKITYDRDLSFFRCKELCMFIDRND